MLGSLDGDATRTHILSEKRIYIYIYLFVCVLMTDRSHNGWKTPLCAEESVTMQASLFIQTAL